MPQPARGELSVVIVARNEEANLKRCLESIKDLAADIVVALNETTDGSASVARGYGARVQEVPWQGYRDTKNASLAFATYEWVLCLDADEELSQPLAAEIRAFVARPDLDEFSGARFPRKVWFIDRWILHGDWYPDHCLRLFHRGRGRWGGDAIVHEKVECDGTVATLESDLHHYSFPTVASHVGKIVPFADMYVRQQKERGGKFSLTAAVFRPWWRFVRAYFLKAGFLDGYPGFYIAVANAFGVFFRQTRLFEEERRTPRGETFNT